MSGKRNQNGFTLAEMLIVVAIIVVLMGVAFVGVQAYQSSMTRLEFDTIAKEIFVAAQNHLTTAQSQGYMDKNIYARPEEDDEDKNDDGEIVCWYAVSGDTESEAALEVLLPGYAVDGTVLSGSYVIRYQPSTATVLDVFFSRPGRASFLQRGGTTLSASDYTTLMGEGDNNYREGGEKHRENYKGRKTVIGWYGGGTPVDRGERLLAPSFEIINAERLLVRVTDPNSALDSSMKLIVTGKTSGAKKYFSLVKDKVSNSDNRIITNAGTDYTVILDDITYKDSAGTLHFADIMADPDDGTFLPGEDLVVKVVAYSNKKLANVALSGEKLTNSLFADPVGILTNGSEAEKGVYAVANIRHLENLDAAVSDFKPSDINKTNDPNTARQMTDLSWKDFKDNTDGDDTVIYYLDAEDKTAGTTAGCYYPVSPDHAIEYDGHNHSVSDVEVDFAGPSGMFGTLHAGSSVSNLELIDFDITATSGNAGALAGKIDGTTESKVTVTNVLAYNTTTGTDATITASGDAGGLIGSAENCDVTKCAAALVVSGSANAGGLIGSMTGDEDTKVSESYSGGYMKQIFSVAEDALTENEKKISVTGTGNAGGLIGSMSGGSVEKCAAALYVSSTGGDAGGLIGSATGGKVEASYSGGHTNKAKYFTDSGEPMYNVTASGKAGGLIGDAGNTTISNSYSTCSAKATDTTGGTAGGFVGTGGGSISGSYCTGLVSGATEGAFAGTAETGFSATNCKYFEIINEIKKDDDGNEIDGYNYLKPLGNKTREVTETDFNIKPFDADADSYDSFVGDPDEWQDAKPYDATLTTYYKGKYDLQTVKQLGASVEDTDLVATHYGDWPAPEEFVFN